MVVKILFTILLVALASSAKAKNYETGESAYKRGDYQTALKHFKPLAERGHAAHCLEQDQVTTMIICLLCFIMILV